MIDNDKPARHVRALRAWIERQDKPGYTRHQAVDLMLLTRQKLKDRIADLANWQTLTEHQFSSPTPIFGSLLAGFRRAWNSISTRWYVLPLIGKQNNFNSRVVDSFEETNTYLDDLIFFIRNVYADLRNLEQRTTELEQIAASSQPTAPDAVPALLPCSTEQIATQAALWPTFFSAGPVAILSTVEPAVLASMNVAELAPYTVADPPGQYLETLPDQSLAGILALWQEPLSVAQIVQLLHQCRRVASDGGWIVWAWAWSAEKPSPITKEIALGLGFQRVKHELFPIHRVQVLALQR